MVKEKKGINGAGIYDERAENYRVKLKFIKKSIIHSKEKEKIKRRLFKKNLWKRKRRKEKKRRI